MNEEGQTRPDMHGPTAFKHTQAAKRNLRQAAEALGYDSVFDLAEAGRDGEIPDDIDHAVRAITNAHSYLEDGSLVRLNEVRSDEM